MGTVLLVEDDPDIRHLVSYKLSTGGFDVIEAANGAEARVTSAVREVAR